MERRHYPLGAQRVRMELPERQRVSRVQALWAGTDLRYKQSGRTVEFVIPAVEDYEVAAIV